MNAETLKDFVAKKSNANHLIGKDVKTGITKSKTSLMQHITDEILNIGEESLRSSLLKLVENDKDFMESASSTGYHHAYDGGTLEHTSEVLRFSIAIAREMNDKAIDMDIVRAGAILHDFGKRNCYELKGNKIETTVLGQMNGHIVHGIAIVSKHVETSKIDKLIHVIASHHNTPEWGSPTRPMTIEAWVVHFADQISSKIYG